MDERLRFVARLHEGQKSETRIMQVKKDHPRARPAEGLPAAHGAIHANAHRSPAEGRAGGPMGAAMPARRARPGGSAGCRRKTEKLKSCEPGDPRRRGRFSDSQIPGSARRAARPRFAYTARDMGAAE
jgi:hypothetical protein